MRELKDWSIFKKSGNDKERNKAKLNPGKNEDSSPKKKHITYAEYLQEGDQPPSE
jgi:hypothetical protein